ncbi:MAG: hypothetical protein PHE41_07225, partial [Eubacteriales bacterium]|nr:hypothetical protein [Eubacteriales bacterium]
MKKTASYFITMILILSLCVSTASAITPNSINASLYLDSYTVMIDATGGGRLKFIMTRLNIHYDSNWRKLCRNSRKAWFHLVRSRNLLC